MALAKFWTSKILILKVYLSKKILSLKKFWVQKKCGYKKRFNLYNISSYKIEHQKIWVQERLRVPKDFESKIFLRVKNDFAPKEFVKKNWVEKNFGPVMCGYNKNFVKKIILEYLGPNKNFMSKKSIGQF